jgi:hypothetical protein
MNRTSLFNKSLHDAGLNQKDYCKLTGRRHHVVSRWQNGKCAPPIEAILFLELMADKLSLCTKQAQN